MASVRFRLDEDDKTDLEGIAPELASVTGAEVTRRYSGQYAVGFNPLMRSST